LLISVPLSQGCQTIYLLIIHTGILLT